MFHVLTCADTKFYPLALRLAKNIRLFPECRLYLYDLGLQEGERRKLEQLGVRIEHVRFAQDTFCMNSCNNIRTTHKIDCIEHFLQKYGVSVLVLDADVLVVEDCFAELSLAADEIFVTYRCDREKKAHIMSNGKINAGVMGFGSAVEHAFFARWRDVCADKEQTDQSALSLLLDACVDWTFLGEAQPCMGYRVRIVDGNVYNDTTCLIGKLFHFKSVGRRWTKKIGYRLFAAVQRLFPALVQKAVVYNRKHRLWVWKAKKAQ